MRIPDTVSFAYSEALAVIEPLAAVVGARLRNICVANNWLFDDRIKNEASCLAKLEAGSFPLSNLHDFYAATIVVPTQNELGRACGAVLDKFEGGLVRRDLRSPNHFAYDDIHALVWLGSKVSPRSVSAAAVLHRKFEVQIRTGLQYGWWRATHDSLYKGKEGEKRSWGMERAAGQARASLELIDGLMSDLPIAASLLRDSHRPEPSDMPGQRWLVHWPMSARPPDIFGFCANVSRLVEACSVDLDQVGQIVTGTACREFRASKHLTPIQVVLIAIDSLIGVKLGERLLGAEMRILVTRELTDACPAMKKLPELVVASP